MNEAHEDLSSRIHKFLPKSEGQFWGGCWHSSRDAQRLDSYNPSTGQRLADVQLASLEDVDAAVQSATQAFSSWAITPPLERARRLREAASRIRANAADLALLDAADCREAARIMVGEHRLSIARACRAAKLSRAAYYRQGINWVKRDAPVIDALNIVVEKHRRWGFWKCFDRMHNQGHPWNHKRVHRVYCKLGLNLRLRELRGLPVALRMDNGPELIAQELMDWCERNGVDPRHIQPGKPNQNAYIDRYNCSFRNEVLDAHVFENLEQVRELSAEWLRIYNEERPHDALIESKTNSTSEQST